MAEVRENGLEFGNFELAYKTFKRQELKDYDPGFASRKTDIKSDLAANPTIKLAAFVLNQNLFLAVLIVEEDAKSKSR